jgi:hypothetical protein
MIAGWIARWNEGQTILAGKIFSSSVSREILDLIVPTMTPED